MSDKPAWLKSNYPLLTTAHVNCLTNVHRGRVETLMAVDDLIGTIVARLQANEELTQHRARLHLRQRVPARRASVSAKQQAYEEAMRVPLYVKGPGVAGPATAQQMVVNVDLAPTILELAEATAGLTLDGRSLVPVLADPGFAPWRTYFLIEHDKVSSSPVVDYAAVRSATHLWVEYADGERELYDLATDPHQLTSEHRKPDDTGR